MAEKPFSLSHVTAPTHLRRANRFIRVVSQFAASQTNVYMEVDNYTRHVVYDFPKRAEALLALAKRFPESYSLPAEADTLLRIARFEEEQSATNTKVSVIAVSHNAESVKEAIELVDAIASSRRAWVIEEGRKRRIADAPAQVVFEEQLGPEPKMQYFIARRRYGFGR